MVPVVPVVVFVLLDDVVVVFFLAAVVVDFEVVEDTAFLGIGLVPLTLMLSESPRPPFSSFFTGREDELRPTVFFFGTRGIAMDVSKTKIKSLSLFF